MNVCESVLFSRHQNRFSKMFTQKIHFILLLILMTVTLSTSNLFPFKIHNPYSHHLHDKQDTPRRGLNCDHCGKVIHNKIVGGRNAHVHDFPWMLSVKYWDLDLCGGTLINIRYVITAAHCIKGRHLEMLSVVISWLDILDVKEESIDVTQAVAHNLFDPKTYDYDIGLLRLVRSARLRRFKIVPICLDTKQNDDPIHREATVIGWGKAQGGKSPKPFPRLKKVTLPVVTNDVCKNASGLRSHVITPRMICAGFISGGKDACQGDSGGPLMQQRNGTWYQIGIVSWGVGCAKPGFYGVYTRISQFIDWIHLNMRNYYCLN